MTNQADSRRRLLCGLAAGGVLLPLSNSVLANQAAGSGLRADGLLMKNLHTGESALLPGAAEDINRRSMRRFNVLLRDHRSGDVGAMDPELLKLLTQIRQELGTDSQIEVISGYRSPRTNAMLRRASNGVAKQSMHMEGRAIDIRIPGVGLRDLRDAAIDLKAGGVGYYRRSAFVHIDTGRFRTW